MITTVTMNAAIDKTYITPAFSIDKLHRVQEMYAFAGGKGINVARVIHALKEPVTASGIIAGYNGRFIEAALDQEGIPHQFVAVQGESRLCLAITDTTAGTVTELLEAGPTLTEEDVAQMKHTIAQLASSSTHVVMSGSLPQGCPTSFYRDCMDIIREQGAIPVLDTSGDALISGIEGRPLLIKPNEHEVLKLTGRDQADDELILEAIDAVMKQGVQNVVVSLGEHGALAGMNNRIYRVTIPKVEVVNTVGSGDSMIAGVVVGDKRGLLPEEQLMLGAACGTANALTPAAGMVSLSQVQELMKSITVQQIN
ncbi:1-phosphofructokinase [Paenibacillus sp. 1001270B_150601_E10]|uniref:1-phosphofructokinase n=1 Tax=Paenibacillus sp. 1001270B_150601_E10 TaxID=2787079 RepID=UPI0018A0B7E5|nr:1-phosphofructokinase [Paenibacillus sp. 1001270B_150601_E10]